MKLVRLFTFGLFTLLMAAALSSGCKSEQNDETGEKSAEEPSPEPSPEPDKDELQDDAEPAEPLTEVGRVDMVGFVYGVAVGPTGEVLVTTRDGRKAAYLYHPDDPPEAAPASLELEEHAHTPFPVGDGLFALPQPETVLIVQSVKGDPRALAPLSTVPVTGEPADVVMQFGRMWVATRQAADGQGLVAVDPRTGVVVGRQFTGSIPIDLSVGEDSIFLTALADNDNGRILRIVDADLSKPDAVEDISVSGIPMQVLPREDGGVLLRNNQKNRVMVSTDPLAVGDDMELPFEPRGAVLQGNRILMVDGVSRLASVPLKGGDTAEAEVGKGTIALAAYGDDRLLVVDSANHEVILFDSASLARLAALPLKARGGQVATDPARNRVYVTIPDRGELLVAEVE